MISGVPDPARARAREAAAHLAPAEPRALGVLAVMAVAAILWVLVPVGLGVLIGTLLAFATSQLNEKLARRTRRPGLVALGLTLGTSLLVASVVGALLYLLVVQGLSVVSQLPSAVASGGPADSWLEEAVRPLAPLHVDAASVTAQIRGAVGGIAASIAGWAARTALIVGDGLVALFFTTTTMYVVLRRWRALARRAERLMPINPHHTRRLLRDVHRLGRSVLVGNFGTAFVQGALAGLGFWLGQVPHPAVLGALTGVVSLVPAFGTLLVWGPAGAMLVATGHTASGVFVWIWGAVLVVGVCDYFIRPRLVGQGETMSTWMTFVALFGGLKLFGLVGFFLGPVFVGVALAVLRVYERTRRFRLGLR